MSENIKDLREAIKQKIHSLKNENIFLLLAMGAYLAALEESGEYDPSLNIEDVMKRCGILFSTFRVELEGIMGQLKSCEKDSGTGDSSKH